ncbi:MAG: hypothetical protein ACLR13_07995 [Acutalibacteraceae bacterium]
MKEIKRSWMNWVGTRQNFKENHIKGCTRESWHKIRLRRRPKGSSNTVKRCQTTVGRFEVQLEQGQSELEEGEKQLEIGDATAAAGFASAEFN